MGNEIVQLVRFSNAVGNNPSLIQAGGGNTSAKDGRGMMHIKSSGFTLAEMTLQSGYVSLDYKQVVDFFSTLDFIPNDLSEEGRIAAFINGLPEDQSFRPSMEASMHAFLDKYVIHTHPVYLNILSCLDSGEKILREILGGEFIFIPYVSPGYNLGKAVADAVSGVSGTKAIILGNHGLIVSSDDADEALNLTNEINEKIKDYLVSNFEVTDNFTIPDLEYVNDLHGKKLYKINLESATLVDQESLIKNAIYPDFTVYSQKNTEFAESEEAIKSSLNDTREGDADSSLAKIFFVKNNGIYYFGAEKRCNAMHAVLSAVLFILNGISKIGKAHYLPLSDVDYLCNMDSEEYRKQLIS